VPFEPVSARPRQLSARIGSGYFQPPLTRGVRHPENFSARFHIVNKLVPLLRAPIAWVTPHADEAADVRNCALIHLGSIGAKQRTLSLPGLANSDPLADQKAQRREPETGPRY